MQAHTTISEQAWLERYHGIEKFATYSIEAKHADNKTQLNRGSNKALFGLANATKQQLEADVRRQIHDPGWSKDSLELCARLAHFVESSTQTSS